MVWPSEAHVRVGSPVLSGPESESQVTSGSCWRPGSGRDAALCSQEAEDKSKEEGLRAQSVNEQQPERSNAAAQQQRLTRTLG